MLTIPLIQNLYKVSKTNMFKFDKMKRTAQLMLNTKYLYNYTTKCTPIKAKIPKRFHDQMYIQGTRFVKCFARFYMTLELSAYKLYYNSTKVPVIRT